MGMEQGFSHVVLLDCDTIELKPEVYLLCDFFHSIRFKVNKGWSKALLLFLCPYTSFFPYLDKFMR